MKLMSFAWLVISVGLSFSSSSQGGQDTCLGRATSAQHCAQIAGNAGYSQYKFHAGTINGIYYRNLCFGLVPRQGGGGDEWGGWSGNDPQFKGKFEALTANVRQASANVEWFIVSHNGDAGNVVFNTIANSHDELDKKLADIREKARYGLNAYELRTEIAEAKVLYGTLRVDYSKVEYLVRPNSKMYWTELEKWMQRL